LTTLHAEHTGFLTSLEHCCRTPSTVNYVGCELFNLDRKSP